MAASINRITLLGHVGADPDIRSTQDGRKIASFRLATNEKWKDKTTGELRELVDWHPVVVFSEGLAGLVEQYVRKGSRLYVEGKSRTRKWTDRDGNERWITEVILQGFDGGLVLLDGAGHGAGNRPPAPAHPDAPLNPPAQPRRAAAPDLDDEVPF